MDILIKNMLSLRCKKLVETALYILDIEYESVELGIVKTNAPLSLNLLFKLNAVLVEFDLEIINDKNVALVEKIKLLISKRLTNGIENSRDNFRTYIAKSLNYDYHYLSDVFTKIQGITLYKYLIAQKINKIKQLLLSHGA